MITISPELVKDLSKGLRIPAHPEILGELDKELKKAEPDIGKITNVIERDPGMVSSVLMIVNSSAYVLTRKINSIRHAIMLLGLDTIRVLTIASLLSRSFDQNKCAIPLKQFWDTTMDVSKVARHLFAHIGQDANEDDMQLLSLFYGCGIPVMATKYENYSDVLAYSEKHDIDLSEHEDKTYATSHPIVGFLMAKTWKVPGEVCQMILNFSQADALDVIKEPGQQRAFALVKLAQNIVSETLSRKSIKAWFEIRETLFDTLGLDADSYAELVKNVVEETQLAA